MKITKTFTSLPLSARGGFIMLLTNYSVTNEKTSKLFLDVSV